MTSTCVVGNVTYDPKLSQSHLVAEKNLRGLEAQLAVLQKKVDEHVAMLGDYESQNKRTASENAMLFTK